jgi:hypothetical protein
MLTHKQAFNVRHGYKPHEPHSLSELAAIAKMPLGVLRAVFARGVGAYSTNPGSVRPHVKSEDEWAQARVYSFLNKLESGAKLNHDTDLISKRSVRKRL